MRRGGSASAWGFLAPYLFGVAALVVFPALLTLRYAFSDATGLSPTSNFNGLTNYRRMLADPFFFASLRASLIHVAIAVPLRLFIAAGLGLLLAAPRRGGRLYRAAVYLPTVVPDVALALLFLWVLNPLYGPLNQILGALGLPQPVWLTTSAGARAGVILMLLFPIGEAFLVVLATRRAIAPHLYEAAALDGCSPLQSLRRITLPVLAPVLTLLALRDTVLSLQAIFVPTYALTDGRPANATLYIPIYLYDQAFEYAGLGYAAFLTLCVLVVTVGLIVLQLLLARRWRVLR